MTFPSSPDGEKARVRALGEQPTERVAIWHDLVLAMHLLETALDRQAQREAGISHGQFKLLVLLSASTNQTLQLKDLADSLHFSPSRVSHALSTLEHQNLVARRPTTGGRRATEATLTNEGRLLVGRVLRTQRRDIRDPLFHRLGEIGTVALGELCVRAIEVFEDHEGDAA